MRIFKMNNTDFNTVKHVIDGTAFHRPSGTEHTIIKFVTKKIQNQILGILDQNNITIEDTGTTE